MKYESVQWTVSPKRQLYKKHLAAEVIVHHFNQADVLVKNATPRCRTGGTDPKQACTPKTTINIACKKLEKLYPHVFNHFVETS